MHCSSTTNKIEQSSEGIITRDKYMYFDRNNDTDHHN